MRHAKSGHSHCFKLITLTLILFSFMTTQSALGARKSKRSQRRFPRGCRHVGFEFKNDLLILKPLSEETPQTLYMFHNTSNSNIILKLVKQPHEVFSPNYENKIRPYQWAAFAMDKENMQFSCKKSYRNSTDDDTTDCGGVLEVCQYTRAKFGGSNKGNYWVVSSSPRYSTVRTSIQKGILLRW